MNKRSLALLAWIFGASLVLEAQNPVYLDQTLAWQGSSLQTSGSNTTNWSFANYTGSLTMPILDYRLGTVSLLGGAEYSKVTDGPVTQTTFGIASEGFQGSLFPFQPYHILFDYVRSQAPADSGQPSGAYQTMGLGLRYQGEDLKFFRFDVRRNLASQMGLSQDSTLWSVSGIERIKGTDINFSAEHLETTSAGQTWTLTEFTAGGSKSLGKSWTMGANVTGDFTMGASNLGLALSLSGILDDWSSTSAVTTNYAKDATDSYLTMAVAQGLSRALGNFSVYTLAGLSGSSGQASTGTGGTAENVGLGVIYRLNKEWRLSGDVSYAAVSAPPGMPANANTLTSFHVGVGRGGGMPELFQQTMYFWSDLRFKQHIQEDFPPDYVPSDLATEILRRKLARQGDLQFTADLFRTQGDLSSYQNLAHVSGSLSFENGFMVAMLGNWQKDDGLVAPGAVEVTKTLNMNMAKSLGAIFWHVGGTYTESFGSGNDASLSPQLEPVPSSLPSSLSHQSTESFNVGFNANIFSRTFGRVPFSVSLLRSHDSSGLEANSLVAGTGLEFRLISMGLTVQRDWRSDGLRTNEIFLHLSRRFNTVTLWGN